MLVGCVCVSVVPSNLFGNTRFIVFFQFCLEKEMICPPYTPISAYTCCAVWLTLSLKRNETGGTNADCLVTMTSFSPSPRLHVNRRCSFASKGTGNKG